MLYVYNAIFNALLIDINTPLTGFKPPLTDINTPLRGFKKTL